MTVDRLFGDRLSAPYISVAAFLEGGSDPKKGGVSETTRRLFAWEQINLWERIYQRRGQYIRCTFL
jgi:hypothetical protein